MAIAARIMPITRVTTPIPDSPSHFEIVAAKLNKRPLRAARVHAIDGAVSYSLEWNGLKMVFGGDTYPNKWFVRYAVGADIAIHECFPTMDQLVDQYRFDPETAINVAVHVHTAPSAFGAIMDQVKPRMAVAWHFYNDFDTRFDVYEQIRTTYDGPLAMADDLLVFNVTKRAGLSSSNALIRASRSCAHCIQ